MNNLTFDNKIKLKGRVILISSITPCLSTLKKILEKM